MNNDQLDMDQMAEAELQRLQRQYRIMEGDRTAFLDEIGHKLKKQRSIIFRLKTEKNTLLTDIKVATSDSRKRKDEKDFYKLDFLLQKHNAVVTQSRKDKAKLEEIEAQIRKTQRQVEKLRLKDVTDLEFQDRVRSGQKAVQILENKLDTTVKRFCGVLTENKSVREEIDHLLKERATFNVMWEKLVEDLNGGKKFILDLIEQATLAYDQREEWCSKLQALKIRAHNDVIVHTQELREVQRQLDHDGKLREFLTIKSQKRVMKDLEEKEMKKRQLEKEEMEEKLSQYEKTLTQIKAFCDEEDVEKIALKYMKQEEENFALFNYVNELNHELEVLEESISELQEKLVEEQETFDEKVKENEETFENIKGKLEEAIEEANEEEKRNKKVEDELREILEGIHSIFTMTGCDVTPILDLLDKNGINEDNVLIYLGLIEKKISVIITSLYFKEKSLLKKKRVH